MYNTDFSDLQVPRYVPSEKPAGVNFISINQARKDVDTALKHAKTKPQVSERILTKTLETLSADEAELIVNMIKGYRRVDGIHKNVFKRVYPQFFRSTEESS